MFLERNPGIAYLVIGTDLWIGQYLESKDSSLEVFLDPIPAELDSRAVEWVFLHRYFRHLSCRGGLCYLEPA